MSQGNAFVNFLAAASQYATRVFPNPIFSFTRGDVQELWQNLAEQSRVQKRHEAFQIYWNWFCSTLTCS